MGLGMGLFIVESVKAILCEGNLLLFKISRTTVIDYSLLPIHHSPFTPNSP